LISLWIIFFICMFEYSLSLVRWLFLFFYFYIFFWSKKYLNVFSTSYCSKWSKIFFFCYWFLFLYFLKLFIYSHVHSLFGSFFPHATTPFLHSHPQFQAGPVLPLSLILLKKRHKHNKEDKTFLLVELRIAIQKYS
jgi:hypothetical protein